MAAHRQMQSTQGARQLRHVTLSNDHDLRDDVDEVVRFRNVIEATHDMLPGAEAPH